jgi:aspartate/methionine/tyrosine aminotransferase
VPDALGAFYFFVRVHTKLTTLTLAERLIRRHRIAVMPGQAFGATDRCAIRISYGALDPTDGGRGHGAAGDGSRRAARLIAIAGP